VDVVKDGVKGWETDRGLGCTISEIWRFKIGDD